MSTSTSFSHPRPVPTRVGRALATIQAGIDRRLAGLPAWVVIARLFIGLGWLRAGVEKMISFDWWRGETLAAFLVEHQETALGWYRPFLDLVVTPNTVAVALTVMLAQLAAGVGLLAGRAVRPGS